MDTIWNDPICVGIKLAAVWPSLFNRIFPVFNCDVLRGITQSVVRERSDAFFISVILVSPSLLTLCF